MRRGVLPGGRTVWEGTPVGMPAPFSDDEQARLRESAAVLKDVIDKLDL